jgi:hypothetical protein
MKQEEVKPGMFITLSTWRDVEDSVSALYVIKNLPDIHAWEIVDLYHQRLSHLSWFAIGPDIVKYEGYLNKAKKIVIRILFSPR